jgi:pimeloyl-ACP methyl ester carboxylesterase
MTNTDSQCVNYRPTRNPRTSEWEVKAPMTEASDQREKNCQLPPPWVIPVIFIPGIMGTNLKAKGSNDAVWSPPNTDGIGSKFSAIGKLFSYLFKDAGERQRELMPDSVELDFRGSIDVADSGLDKKLLRERGWGALMRSSYHPMMGFLQQSLDDFVKTGSTSSGWWGDHGRGSPVDWGDTKGAPALTAEQINHAALYTYEVWGGGYNWLQSNRDSGASIGQLIDSKILPHYRKLNKKVGKVILVTHSMGGLVARALACIHNHQGVLGVAHGVQPATGAPATYKRMRAGFEGAEQVILGRNAAEVTAVLCNAPGGLELLPTADYNSGQPWLRVRDTKHGREAMAALPKSGDPYSDIYASDAWYGLVPKANENLIDPAHQGNLGPEDSIRGKLRDRIKGLQAFHEEIKQKYHPETYAHFGVDPHKSRLTWGEVIWGGEELLPEDMEAGKVERDDQNGVLRLVSGRTLEIGVPNMPGDGTVPYVSGAAPGVAGVKASFEHGEGYPRNAPAAQNGLRGYDHQGSYNDEAGRSRFATLYAIVRCAQFADWHKS